MFEFDWKTATDPLAMLDHLFPQRGLDSVEPQTRQSRLYLLACARRAWDRLPSTCRVLVSVSERIFQGRLVDRRLRNEVYSLAEEFTHCRGEAVCVNGLGRELASLGHTDAVAVPVEEDIDPDLWAGFAHLAFFPFYRTTPHYRRIPADLHGVDLVREVFGNPSEPQPAFNPQWRTHDVLNLARHAHSLGDFSALPVLADALEEAGCDRQDILDHLRFGGPHVRGCWALELAMD